MATLRSLFLMTVLMALLAPGYSASASPFPSADASAPVVLHVLAGGDLQAALNTVPDHGVVELASGSYRGGFSILNPRRGFTVRAASGASVVLDGQHSQPVLNFQNSTLSDGGAVLFERLTFANGATSTNGLAAGVTMYRAQATFVDCNFRNNAANVNTAGGAAYVAEDSTAFFFNTSWQNNSNPSGGGGLGIQSRSKVYIHNSVFLSNTSIALAADRLPGGAGISTVDSLLRISNTRFEDNHTTGHGGALYVLGSWNNTPTQPTADVLVANSTFVNNLALREPGAPGNVPCQGGAVNIENQSRVRIYNSRFTTNRSMIGGAINLYRSQVEVHGSVFRANLAIGPSLSNTFAGAIAADSQDGLNNLPVSQILIEDSLIQGRYGSVTTVAPAAGGLLIGGNALTHARAELNRVAFYDLDVAPINASELSVGGGIEATRADLILHDSIVAKCDASGGQWPGAGGLVLMSGSTADIQNTMFAANTAEKAGGALYIHASTANVSNSQFVNNAVAPASRGDTEYSSLGAAIFSAPDGPTNAAASGLVANNVFADNVGLTIFDDDRQEVAHPQAINSLRYNNNTFYERTYADRGVYRDGLPATQVQTAAGLNSLTVQRQNGLASTDKGQGNVESAGTPVMGKLLAVPPEILPIAAAGDPTGPTASYLVYAFHGSSARLDGSSLSESAGVVACASPGTHTMALSGVSYSAPVTLAPLPAASLSASPSGNVLTLQWGLRAGDFLDAAIDGGVTTSAGPSGQVQRAETISRTYRYYVITRQGGYVATSESPHLNAPTSLDVLAGRDRPLGSGSIPIVNTGSGILQWTATPGGNLGSRIQLAATSGQVVSGGNVCFTINAGGMAVGQYTGYVDINAGTAGVQRVNVQLKVVSVLKRQFLPAVGRS